MRHKFLRVLGGAAALAVVLGTAACADDSGDSGSNESTGKDCTIKIAFVGALTGPNAALGINIANGAQLAIDQYNNNPDRDTCKIDLDKKDSQGDEKQAPGIAQQLVGDAAVRGVIGPAFSGESKASNQIYSDNGVTIITASATNPTLAEQGWKTFHRALGNDATQGPAAGRYIKNTLNAQRVFIIDDTSEYGKGLAEQVRTVITNPVGTGTTSAGQTDFSALITAIQAANADAIFYGGYYAEAGPLVRQLRGQGVTAKFVSGDGVKDAQFVTGAGAAAAEGTILTCPCVPPEKAESTFIADYKAAFNQDPGTYSAEGYDAATIFTKAVAAGNIKRGVSGEGTVNEFVNNFTGELLTTDFKFLENGDLDPKSVAVWAYEVQGGVIVGKEEIPNS